jgi:hypothetical protein
VGSTAAETFSWCSEPGGRVYTGGLGVEEGIADETNCCFNIADRIEYGMVDAGQWPGHESAGNYAPLAASGQAASEEVEESDKGSGEGEPGIHEEPKEGGEEGQQEDDPSDDEEESAADAEECAQGEVREEWSRGIELR